MHLRTVTMILPLALMFAVQARATEAPANGGKNNPQAYCLGISTMAGSIARAKANGAPKEKLIEMTNKQPQVDPLDKAVHDISLVMIETIYASNEQSTPEEQQKNWNKECLKSRGLKAN